jgi:predicted nucleic acid-binding protein
MTALLDTDVLIDCLRGTPNALNWLTHDAATSFQVPGIVAMELLAGCRNQPDIQRVQAFLSAFDVVWPEATEFARAYALMAQYRLVSALSIPDCLIAAVALSRAARLYTFNLRHFQVVTGLDAQEPYART